MIDVMGIVKRRFPDSRNGAEMPAGKPQAARGRGRARSAWILVGFLAIAPLLSACSSASLPDAPLTLEQDGMAPDYRISPLDTLQVTVWEAPEFSTTAPVRPDGRISVPMLQDIMAAGKTPAELSLDIKNHLTKFMRDALVTVTVSEFSTAPEQQVHVVGQAVKPAAIPYRQQVRVLDVMVAAGGLTKFADGNRAILVRQVGGKEKSYRLRLDDLLKGGMVSANVPLLPGDVLIIPETYF